MGEVKGGRLGYSHANHECLFPEVEVLEDDEPPGVFKAGMRVIVPCPDCGEPPLDHLQLLSGYVEEYGRALTAAKPAMPLFHWAPAVRRKQIIRYGLRPFMRVTTSTGDDTGGYPVICLADSTSWAWALSGDLAWTPTGEWDLWQTSLDRLREPVILPGEDRLSGIYEVRTEHRIYKRDLWWVGSRTKPERTP